jgi:hypothetical protein
MPYVFNLSITLLLDFEVSTRNMVSCLAELVQVNLILQSSESHV